MKTGGAAGDGRGEGSPDAQSENTLEVRHARPKRELPRLQHFGDQALLKRPKDRLSERD